MCPTERCTTGETPRARTRAKVVISCSTFSNADHGYSTARGAQHNSATWEPKPYLYQAQSKTKLSHTDVRLYIESQIGSYLFNYEIFLSHFPLSLTNIDDFGGLYIYCNESSPLDRSKRIQKFRFVYNKL